MQSFVFCQYLEQKSEAAETQRCAMMKQIKLRGGLEQSLQTQDANAFGPLV